MKSSPRCFEQLPDLRDQGPELAGQRRADRPLVAQPMGQLRHRGRALILDRLPHRRGRQRCLRLLHRLPRFPWIVHSATLALKNECSLPRGRRDVKQQSVNTEHLADAVGLLDRRGGRDRREGGSRGGPGGGRQVSKQIGKRRRGPAADGACLSLANQRRRRPTSSSAGRIPRALAAAAVGQAPRVSVHPSHENAPFHSAENSACPSRSGTDTRDTNRCAASVIAFYVQGL